MGQAEDEPRLAWRLGEDLKKNHNKQSNKNNNIKNIGGLKFDIQFRQGQTRWNVQVLYWLQNFSE